MSADWGQPVLTTAYATFLSVLKDRDLDSATLFSVDPTNLAVGMIRYVRASNKFQEYRTTPSPGWYDLVLSVAGGGTAGISALGTMAFQSSSAVSITGGTLSGVTIALSGDLTFNADGTIKIGTNTNKANAIYIKNGLVVPVGVDKWVTS